MRRATVLLALLPLLAACSFDDALVGVGLKDERGCPAVKVLTATGEVTQFAGGLVAANALIATARLTDATRACRFEGDQVIVTVSFDLGGETGPAFAGGEIAVPAYLEARGEDKQLFGKQEFRTALTFPPGATHASGHLTQDYAYTPPRDADTAKQTLYLGIQLTPAQLAFNRTRAAL